MENPAEIPQPEASEDVTAVSEVSIDIDTPAFTPLTTIETVMPVEQAEAVEAAVVEVMEGTMSEMIETSSAEDGRENFDTSSPSALRGGDEATSSRNVVLPEPQESSIDGQVEPMAQNISAPEVDKPSPAEGGTSQPGASTESDVRDEGGDIQAAIKDSAEDKERSTGTEASETQSTEDSEASSDLGNHSKPRNIPVSGPGSGGEPAAVMGDSSALGGPHAEGDLGEPDPQGEDVESESPGNTLTSDEPPGDVEVEGSEPDDAQAEGHGDLNPLLGLGENPKAQKNRRAALKSFEERGAADVSKTSEGLVARDSTQKQGGGEETIKGDNVPLQPLEDLSLNPESGLQGGDIQGAINDLAEDKERSASSEANESQSTWDPVTSSDLGNHSEPRHIPVIGTGSSGEPAAVTGDSSAFGGFREQDEFGESDPQGGDVENESRGRTLTRDESSGDVAVEGSRSDDSVSEEGKADSEELRAFVDEDGTRAYIFKSVGNIAFSSINKLHASSIDDPRIGGGGGSIQGAADEGSDTGGMGEGGQRGGENSWGERIGYIQIGMSLSDHTSRYGTISSMLKAAHNVAMQSIKNIKA